VVLNEKKRINWFTSICVAKLFMNETVCMEKRLQNFKDTNPINM
jgi:hypothetical protein